MAQNHVNPIVAAVVVVVDVAPAAVDVAHAVADDRTVSHLLWCRLGDPLSNSCCDLKVATIAVLRMGRCYQQLSGERQPVAISTYPAPPLLKECMIYPHSMSTLPL